MDTPFVGSVNQPLAPPRTASRSTDLSPGCRGLLGETFHWEGLTLVIRGYLRPAGSTEPLVRERLAEELRWRYLEQGALDIADLEGSATVVLFDDHDGEVQAARSATSPFPLYYRAEPGRLLLSDQLAELASQARKTLAADPEAAQAWVEDGTLPARQTLFEGLFRLLPGERITFDHRGLCRFALSTVPPGRLTLALLDVVMRDCLSLLGRPAAILVGHWPSVWLQALRNRHLAEDEMLPASLSLAIDEPDAWAETDWVMHLTQRLGTGHALIPAERPAEDLLATLAATAEPPAADVDLFLAPFSTQMRRSGVRTVLLDWGIDPLGHQLSRDQALLRRAEQALTCLGRAEVEALCPFLDARLPADEGLGLVLKPFLPPLPVLPRRPSLLLAWLRPGQPLADFAQQTRTHGLMSARELEKALARPTERFARLVCYDLWHRLFLES
jgi:hypothetical protein